MTDDGPIIRDERPGDLAAVAALIGAAFAGKPWSDGTEAAVAAALRAAGAATVALVAQERGAVAGQVLFSPALRGGAPSGWHALGPVAVAPDRQGRGLGSGLIREGLRRLRDLGSGGCILVGDPGYYARFGFRPAPDLAPPGQPPAHFMVLPFAGAAPPGLDFHPAFGAPGG